MDPSTQPFKRPRIYQEPLESSCIFGSIWTGSEKENFFRALQKYGRRDVRRIANNLKTKSYIEVGLYLDLLERGATEKDGQDSDLEEEEEDEMNSVHPSAQDISTVTLRVEERQANKLLEAEERKAIKRAEKEFNTKLTDEEYKKMEVLHLENALDLSSLLYMKEDSVILKGSFLEMYNCLIRFLVPLIRDVIVFAEEHVFDSASRPQSKMVHLNDVRKALLSRSVEFNRDSFFIRLIERLSKEGNLVEDSDSDSDEPLINIGRRNVQEDIGVTIESENDSTTDDDESSHEEADSTSESEIVEPDTFSDPENTLIYVNSVQTDEESDSELSLKDEMLETEDFEM
ncbi:hypothetical protein K7432_011236 [Basidiobolus ranarum]|uniref:Myb-like domain-containing protein n=1 Tax=Basidiobolus ranarum TaxID=34480 RepID=A0ABR2VUL2_9FUNG